MSNLFVIVYADTRGIHCQSVNCFHPGQSNILHYLQTTVWFGYLDPESTKFEKNILLLLFGVINTFDNDWIPKGVAAQFT